MHTRRKGKAGSSKPILKSTPSWLSYKPAEVEAIIVKLAKQGNSTSKIGMVLRDSYGIPDAKVVIKKRITEVLKEQKLAPKLPEDLDFLLKKAVNTSKHIDAHKKDVVSKRGLHLIESKIRRLVKYYKRVGVLPGEWKYSLEQAKLLIS